MKPNQQAQAIEPLLSLLAQSGTCGFMFMTAEYTTEAHEYPHPPPHQPQLSSVTGTWAIRP
jgi:hypothetical protein